MTTKPSTPTIQLEAKPTRSTIRPVINPSAAHLQLRARYLRQGGGADPLGGFGIVRRRTAARSPAGCALRSRSAAPLTLQRIFAPVATYSNAALVAGGNRNPVDRPRPTGRPDLPRFVRPADVRFVRTPIGVSPGRLTRRPSGPSSAAGPTAATPKRSRTDSIAPAAGARRQRRPRRRRRPRCPGAGDAGAARRSRPRRGPGSSARPDRLPADQIGNPDAEQPNAPDLSTPSSSPTPGRRPRARPTGRPGRCATGSGSRSRRSGS